MIAQISVSWNEKYEHDGFLFFAQRIVEMLDYMTVDIYRAPLLNTSRLIDEYLRIGFLYSVFQLIGQTYYFT